MRALAIFCLALLFAACGLLGISANELALKTEHGAYSAGAIVGLSIENRSSVPYQMGNFGCATLERRTDRGWEGVNPPDGYGCTGELVHIPPDGRAEGGFALFSDVSAAEYRILQTVFIDIREGQAIPIASNSFEVR